MNPRDAIIMALTPGSPFNEKGLIYRSTQTLGAFAGIEAGEVLDLIAGDLSAMVSCKPSKKGKGIMVALKAQLQAQPVAPLKVAGGPAFNVPLVAAAKEAQELNAPIEAAVIPAPNDLDELEENLQDELDEEEDEF